MMIENSRDGSVHYHRCDGKSASNDKYIFDLYCEGVSIDDNNTPFVSTPPGNSLAFKSRMVFNEVMLLLMSNKSSNSIQL